MKLTSVQFTPGETFDLVRLGRSKRVVDLSDNTLRAYNRQGLPFYRMGKAVFFSRAELANFIRTKASLQIGEAA